MKVSILTITRNDLAGLRRTLESVRRQNLLPEMEVEHVVVDSSDYAVAQQVREACGGNVVYIWSQPEGIYPAMNRALEASTGEVVGILNGGDVYADPTVVMQVVEALERIDADFVLSDVVYRNSQRYYWGDEFSIKSMEQGIAPPHPAFYARRKVYDSLGNYNEKYRIVGDFDFFARLVKDGSFKGSYIPGPLVEMELGGASQTLRNRLWFNTLEKYSSLKSNGLKASWLRLYCRFLLIFYKQYLYRRSK